MQSEVDDGQTPFDYWESKNYCTGVGLALYLSYDWVDAQHAVRELAKDMKQPTTESLRKMRRLGTRLPRSGELDIYSDTDWANCKKTRKSCACSIFMVGNRSVCSDARSLQMLCLSSAEAEFNGGVAACSEGLFLVEVVRFFGIKLDMTVYLDSSAARGVFQRQGCGRIRHHKVNSLCVQNGL